MKRTRLRPISKKRAAEQAAMVADIQEHAELADAWWRAVVKGKRCVLCGSPVHVQGHHVISQQTLKRVARDDGLDLHRLLWNPRNGIPVCEPEHAAHTFAMKRIPRSALPREALTFARELDLTWLVEKDYPA